MYGKVNDILLLSQSFDDTANYEHFLPPEGAMLLDWIKGDDEVSFCSVTMYLLLTLELPDLLMFNIIHHARLPSCTGRDSFVMERLVN